MGSAERAPRRVSADRAPRRVPGPGGSASSRRGLAAVQALQRSAGNAAVTAAVQRYAEPAAPAHTTAVDDPRFASVKSTVAGAGRRLRAHPPAKAEAKKASDAAVMPAGDRDAQAKAGRADTMEKAKPGGFDKAAFIAQVKAALAAKAPKNLSQAMDFGESGKAGEVKAEVAGQVSQGKQQAAKDIREKTETAPDPSVAVDKKVVPLAPDQAPQPTVVDPGKATPLKAPPEQTDLSGGQRETEGAMAQAEVTEDQLAQSNEPEFTGAVEAKKEGEAHSATAPGPVRELEAQTLATTKAGAGDSARAGLAAMLGSKRSMLSRGGSAKSAAKTKDEQERSRVTSAIQTIFDKTKLDVGAILGGVDKEVTRRFDAQEKLARDAFTAHHSRRMDAYKDDRYSGVRGKARWVRDKFKGLPSEANGIYQVSKKLYEQHMDAGISLVADFIGSELVRAKGRIALGRNQIKDFVTTQPKNLQKLAAETATTFTDQFEQLEGDVDSKQEQLAEDLASKYDESRKSVDAEIEKMQEENKGLWDKVVGAIAGVIRTILQLKDMLLNVLARAASAIGSIITDPIGFLGKFVSAVKTGITNFGENIVEHLKTGLKEWLFGALATAGVELPEKFDLPGVVKLVLSLLGLTWTSIRARIVKQIPETVMDKVEKGVDFIQVVLSEGLGGIGRWVLEKVGDIKEMVMSQLEDFVVTKIVKAGITWLISLLNPAAAFIKACKMIYDVVMFFVENGSRIKEFVDSVLDSVESIASGGVGAVAALIEKSLAKIIPLLLGFLASLLNLDAIPEKVKGILETVQKPVSKVVDFLVGKAVRYGKSLIARGKAGAGKALGGLKAKILGGDDSPEGKQKRLTAGVNAGVAIANRFAGRPVGDKVLRPLLGGVRVRYGLGLLQPEREGRHWAIHGEVQRMAKKSDAEVEGAPTTTGPTPAAVPVEWVLPPDTAIVLLTGTHKDQSGRYVSVSSVAVSGTPVWMLNYRLGGRNYATMARPGSMPFQKGVGQPDDPRPRVATAENSGASRGQHWAGEVGVSGGSSPSQDPSGWSVLADGPKAWWTRSHLLNGALDGPGLKWNLAITPVAINNRMKDAYEKVLVRAAHAGRRFRFDVTFGYHRDGDKPEQVKALTTVNAAFKVTDFPASVHASFSEIEPAGAPLTGGLPSTPVELPEPRELDGYQEAKLVASQPKRRRPGSAGQ